MDINQLTETSVVISTEQLLKHWQGHRTLTRKVIEAYPEDKFFDFSIGGMRPFSELLQEIIDLSDSGIEGIVTGKWGNMNDLAHVTGNGPKTKTQFLEKWDEVTFRLNQLWPEIEANRFQESIKAFGMYDGTVSSTIFYFIDNEIHHRGQAFVYLRALGITPPAFWDRY